MKKILLFTFLGLSCCTPEIKETKTTKEQEIETIENEFTTYLDLLPTLTLPLEINCDKCCDHLRMDYKNELIDKFKPEGASIIGLVSRTENIAIILVTYPADMIITLKVYDLEGNLTGDMTFLTSDCGGEPGIYSREFFRINTDLSLNQIDTLYETTFDSLTYQILDTTNIEITKKDFKINEKGEIVEDNAR